MLLIILGLFLAIYFSYEFYKRLKMENKDTRTIIQMIFIFAWIIVGILLIFFPEIIKNILWS